MPKGPLKLADFMDLYKLSRPETHKIKYPANACHHLENCKVCVQVAKQHSRQFPHKKNVLVFPIPKSSPTIESYFLVLERKHESPTTSACVSDRRLYPTAQAEGPGRCCMPPCEAYRLHTSTNQDKGPPRRSSSKRLGFRKVK